MPSVYQLCDELGARHPGQSSVSSGYAPCCSSGNSRTNHDGHSRVCNSTRRTGGTPQIQIIDTTRTQKGERLFDMPDLHRGMCVTGGSWDMRSHCLRVVFEATQRCGISIACKWW